jgi:hypothetical protein
MLGCVDIGSRAGDSIEERSGSSASGEPLKRLSTGELARYESVSGDPETNLGSRRGGAGESQA